MKYSNIPSAQTLILYFESMGIKRIVISPGSRNAPLTLGFSKNPYFDCHSIVDERSAAFFALGMAQQLREPVAVVCTSGSALLNYYPAVAEAFYSDIPLVVVSADRPVYRIDIGDGQTIRQSHALEKHVACSVDLKQDLVHAPQSVAEYGHLGGSQQEIQAHNEAQLQKALGTAIAENAPVHINIPFEEPLYGQLDHPLVELAPIPMGNPAPPPFDGGEYRGPWRESPRKMVLVGVKQPHVLDPEVIEALGTEGNTLVLTETTSNLHHPEFFPSIDSILAPIENSADREALFEQLRPDLLITFGGLVVSKKIKAFLRSYPPRAHWHIDPKKAYDTFFCLSAHIRTDPNGFFRSMGPGETREGPYKRQWKAAKARYVLRRAAYLQQVPFSDFSVFDSLLRRVPPDHNLQLANSSTVRYAQLFDLHPGLKVHCNRGTSGIDGSTSTAVGASIHAAGPTLLISGDLGFLYDSNGLWNPYIRPDFRIVVINNGGGGIFRILPGREDTEAFGTFFETQHAYTAEHLAAMFGFDYVPARDMGTLEAGLSDFFGASERPKILEVFTPRTLNNKILLDYFEFIS